MSEQINVKEELDKAKAIFEKLKDNQACKMCKNDLDVLSKATNEVSIKQDKMGSMLDELERTDSLGVINTLAPKRTQIDNDPLGLHEISTDLIDASKDVVDIRESLKIPVAALNTITKSNDKKQISRLPAPPRLHELLPLPHQIFEDLLN